MKEKDSLIAQQIIEGNIRNQANFESTSFIYKTTNEWIYEYQSYFLNNEKILLPISSGEQILTAISFGKKTIDIYDLNRFALFYFHLKVAAIKALKEVENYLFFFYQDSCPTFDTIYDDFYTEIRNYLEKEDQEFWDFLFQFYDWSYLSNSLLFSQEPVYLQKVMKNNPYLEKDSYQTLRKELSSVTINSYLGDISDLAISIKEKYDLVYLSNICFYKTKGEYFTLLENLPLEENGVALTYVYREEEKYLKEFPLDTFQPFKEHSGGILVHQKKKKFYL